MAGENRSTRRRILRDAAGTVRATDRDRMHLLIAHVNFVIAQKPSPLLRLRVVLGLQMLPDVRNADHPRPGLDRDSDLQPFVLGSHVLLPLAVPVLTGAREAHRSRPSGGITPDREPLKQLSIEADFQLLRPSHTHDVILPVRSETNPDQILPINRKMMANRDTTARTEWQIFTLPPVLDQVLGHFVGGYLGIDRREAYGQPRDLTSHGHVAFHVGGRERQSFRHIVEAPVRRRIAGQQGHDIDIDSEQIVDRIVVLSAIQTVHRGHPTRIRLGGPSTVELCFQPGRRGVIDDGFRARCPRGGHRTPPKLLNHLLQRLRVGTRILEVHCVERESPAHQSRVVACNAV